MPKQAAEGPLVTAARALEAELAEYAALTDEIRNFDVNSEKTLARASRAMNEATSCHERVLEKVSALSAAMVATRELQERCITQMAEGAQRVSARATAFRELLGRYERLVEESRTLNVLAMKTASLKASGAPPEELAEAVGGLLAGTGALVDAAASLSAAAAEGDFQDLARTIDGLRQQMQSARNKLSLAGLGGNGLPS